MSRSVRFAAVQPPVPEGDDGRDHCVQRGLEMAEEAVEAGADLIGFPEYFGLYGLPPGTWQGRLAAGDSLLAELSDLARRAGVGILYPSAELSKGRMYNTTWFLDETGKVVERYRKVHLTRDERETKGISPGDRFAVARMKGLSTGVMTCYDGYFPEAARILSLKGAWLIYFPSLQRAATSDTISLQVRSRALDSCVYVVRCSYGYPRSEPWRPGMMVGMTCAADCEGRMIGDLGTAEGVLTIDVPLDGAPLRLRSAEGKPEDPRAFLVEDRRPDTYGALVNRPMGRRSE